MKLGWRTSITWRSGSASTARQELEEGLEVRRRTLGRRELPDDRPELVELGQAAADEALDRFAGLAEHAPVGRVARGLDREHEVVGRRVAPLREARRALRAVVGAVDLDRGDLPARVLELARLRQPGRIEGLAPGLVDQPPTPRECARPLSPVAGLASNAAEPVGLEADPVANVEAADAVALEGPAC